ncbi:hypothetical protein A1A1_17650 [Planococcus antarcticus DSM 14505]|uniref:Uncharacterized protein n=1 Tax=Planococcus antarcticus DSM 14505 TaxID=1185653 RepID=A0AA87LSL0_9BACL|nr:hypothetical protein [Planococcus antarcticus]EIM05127.1 hypothetical protein A1A1_17650 [Planococcus antarcticus DSM 14505]
MNGFQLLDEQDNRIYFVFTPDHPHPFSFFEQHLETVMERVESKAPSREQCLWILKRIAIICEDKISYFPDNELLIEPDVFMETTIQLDYIILLFIKYSPSAPFELQPVETIESHPNFEDAQKFAIEQIALLKTASPDIEIKALGAKMIYNVTLS